ncbi:TetR/AcrR family transcriptional regulator [Saccharopolyspora sp. K220]|uniref:TetR/AcrR family transcriptional regulator n=1 Tax=Saccharopolyspora soli TaxID=2926618 RepID=UPI001F55DD7E|nr:TetR/AcrR family transcriptional regulator [Saccharopolyspora soli]MCI2423016.1 TetR/AcrR family transcriptional regulator [Saccharopolyspora soli]
MAEERGTTTQRVRNRWGEGDRLRGEILEGASRLLSELGASDALTIRGVARAVGITAPSIYRHFADRDALVQGLLEHEFGRLREMMRAADENTDPQDVVGRVRAQLRAYFDFAIANPGHYRLMLGSGPHRSKPGEHTGPIAEVVDSLTTAFARCEQAGYRFRLDSAYRAASVVFVSIHGRVALLHSNYSEDHARGFGAFIDELISLVLA